MHNWSTRSQHFMRPEMLSYFCIFAPVTNAGAATQRQSQTDRSALMAKGGQSSLPLVQAPRFVHFWLVYQDGRPEEGKSKRFMHINQINRSNKEIPSRAKMWVIQTFAAVYDYNLRQLLNSTRRLCPFCTVPALQPRNLCGRRKEPVSCGQKAF